MFPIAPQAHHHTTLRNFCCRDAASYWWCSWACPSLGKQTPIFVDPGVKINGTYCHDVLPTEQLLSVMHEISGKFFILSYTVLLHTKLVRHYYSSGTRDTRFHFTRPLAPENPDVNPVDYRSCGQMQQCSTRQKFVTLCPDLPTLVNCEAGHTPPLLLTHLSRFPILSLHIILWPISPLQIQLRDLGERCKLPHQVWAEPGRQTYFSATEAKTGHDAELRALQNG